MICARRSLPSPPSSPALRSISITPTRESYRSRGRSARFMSSRANMLSCASTISSKTPPAQVLVPLLPAAGAQSDLVLSVIPYSLETNHLSFAITDYDLGFHNRIG